MSVKMKKSLRFDKIISTEDDPVIIEDGKLDDYAPDHSTPKRTKNHFQEAQSQEYRSSPILLTQDSNNEVAWDWHSPKTKITSKKQHETSGTPKRHRIIHKKRNSNSPLVYKPSKKRIMKPDNIAKIDEWKKEFLALDAKIETITSHETSRENIESNISDEIIFDDDFEMEDNHQIIIIEDTPPGTVMNTPEKIEKESLKDLFDDSINDESMLKCSQEIEEKLNLESVSKSSKELKRFGLVKIPSKVSSEPVVVSAASSFTSKFKKYKSDPIDKNSPKNEKTSAIDFKITDLFDDDDFDIPDDSFDEIVLSIPVDAAQYERKNGCKGSIIKKCSSEIGNGNNCDNKTPQSSMNNKKFFRSRNRSDTSFDGKGRFNSNGINYSANTGTASSSKGTVSTEIMDIKRTNSCMDRKQSVMSKENSNCSINNFDRLRVNDDGSVNGKTPPVSQSQNLCTPEEIERKRLEAKMKLEAKRKMQNFGKFIKR